MIKFLFTYCDRKGILNQSIHTGCLNYLMKSVRRRYPNLTPCSPHKLRHTTATLAELQGTSLENTSKVLTHSEVATTKFYFNENNVIEMTRDNFAFKKTCKIQ